MHRPAFSSSALGPWRPSAAPVPPVRLWTARQLRRAGVGLRKLASWLASPSHRPSPGFAPTTLPRLEFHAEAGAPEGALYVDGEYVGRLDVTRL